MIMILSKIQILLCWLGSALLDGLDRMGRVGLDRLAGSAYPASPAQPAQPTEPQHGCAYGFPKHYLFVVSSWSFFICFMSKSIPCKLWGSLTCSFFMNLYLYHPCALRTRALTLNCWLSRWPPPPWRRPRGRTQCPPWERLRVAAKSTPCAKSRAD